MFNWVLSFALFCTLPLLLLPNQVQFCCVLLTSYHLLKLGRWAEAPLRFGLLPLCQGDSGFLKLALCWANNKRPRVCTHGLINCSNLLANRVSLRRSNLPASRRYDRMNQRNVDRNRPGDQHHHYAMTNQAWYQWSYWYLNLKSIHQSP